MAFFQRDRKSVDDYRRSRDTLSRIRGTEEPDAQQEMTEDEPAEDFEPTFFSRPVEEQSTSQTTVSQESVDQYRQGATTVARDSSFSGTLKSDSNLFIEGNFDGELEANSTIFIADTAHVKADVRATDVIVAGKLDGTVTASDRFHAMPTARVSGEINSATLVVEQGSHVNCRFAMKSRGGDNS
jgi:cytoskeletal protein CcmA (bactofilin family)